MNEEALLNLRVIAWARSRGIDPQLLVREPEEDRYLVDGIPWPIPYSEWVMKKWDEWWAQCPDPVAKTCNHCWNGEAFNAWLMEAELGFEPR